MRKEAENSGSGRSDFRFGLHTAIALTVLALIIGAAVYFLPRFGFIAVNREALATASPAPTAVSTPVPTEEPPATTTPAPTAAPTPAPTPTPVPTPVSYVKTAIVIDGEATLVLASRQAAEEVVAASLSYFENRIEALWPGISKTTVFANRIDYAPADEDAEATDFDTAKHFLTGEDSPLRVKTSFTHSEIETVPHETEESESDELYIGTRFVSSYGRDGKKLVVSEYTFLNGELLEAVIREEHELCSAITETVLIGTAPIPEKDVSDVSFGADDCPQTSLSFSKPVSEADIVRFFGFYGGILHRGIDFGSAEGSPCFAAESGVVIAVIERGALGKTVDIEHGHGFVTRYALLGETAVSVGDRVSKGQRIGSASASGVHFEVIALGLPRNPMVYLFASGDQ